MWWNSWLMKRRRWPSHLFFGRWGRNALGCVTGSSFAACDCASAQGLAWNIHEDSIRWAEWNFGLVMIARRASCVFNLLQESPWRFDSFRYFWMFLIGCVLFPCQVDHNLFLWYLRLPPAGVSSKDARHSLPALLAFMSPAMAFIPRNRDMLCWCESFPRGCGMQNVSTCFNQSHNPAVLRRYPKQGVALDYDGWVRLGYTDPIGDFASTLVLDLEMKPQELLCHVTMNPGRFHQQHVIALVHVDINTCYAKVPKIRGKFWDHVFFRFVCLEHVQPNLCCWQMYFMACHFPHGDWRWQ